MPYASAPRYRRQPFKLLRVAQTLLALLALWALSACGSAPRQPATSQTEVKLQTAWVDSHEYSGFYLAQDNGDYAKEQLKLTILPFDGALSPIDQVVDGRAHFGITSMDRILTARAAGKPVVAIMTIYQRSPIAFISLAKNNIVRPQDLVGKTAVIDTDGTTAIAFWALLSSQGIAPEQVDTQPRADFSNAALLDGSADVLDAYINNQPVKLEMQGHEINTIVPSDYGIDLYSNLIFTSEELLESRPELVEGFVRASLRGFGQSIDEPEVAIEATLKRSEELDYDAELRSLIAGLPLLKPAGAQLGMMTAENWNVTHQLMLDQGLLEAPIEVDKAYTLRFLHKVNNQ